MLRGSCMALDTKTDTDTARTVAPHTTLVYHRSATRVRVAGRHHGYGGHARASCRGQPQSPCLCLSESILLAHRCVSLTIATILSIIDPADLLATPSIRNAVVFPVKSDPDPLLGDILREFEPISSTCVGDIYRKCRVD